LPAACDRGAANFNSSLARRYAMLDPLQCHRAGQGRVEVAGEQDQLFDAHLDR
jgi:hypothetical protein